MGSSAPKPASPSSVMKSYSKYLPGLITSTSALTPQIAQDQLAAAKATTPGYNQLNLDQMSQYALPLAQIGQQVQRSNALAGGETQLAQLQNTGIDTARLAQQVAREGSPEYYDTISRSADKTKDLLNSFNMNGLSAGEQNAVERSLNQSNQQTGNLGLTNSLNTVSNAMNFGDRYNQKQQQLGQAIGTANQTAMAASPQTTGFNAVNVALGQPNVSTMGNMGTGTFNSTNAGTMAGASGAGFGFGQGLMGNLSSMNNASTGAASQDYGTKMGLIGQGIGAAASGGGLAAGMGGCCFIVMESYHGTMPSYVRKCRDRYYRTIPEVASGYKRMARWLVPSMRKSVIVRTAVWHLMVKPLTDYGSFIINRTERKGRFACRFWFTIWKQLGDK